MIHLLQKLRTERSVTFWLGICLMLMLAGTAYVVLHIHAANVRKRQEPEVDIHPQNRFQRTLRVVADMDYKPFSYRLGSPVPRGYDVELVTEIANRMGYNLELQLLSWKDAVQTMQQRKADLILGCDWQDVAVMDCNFTIPTFEEKFVVFETIPSKSFSDLYGKRIAIIEGCGLMDTLKHYQLWENCVEYTTVTECARAVLRRECDCFIAHHTIGEVCLRELGRERRQFRGRMDFASGQMCFGVDQNARELFAGVNAALLALRADGTMDRLARKWLERFEEEITLREYLRRHPVVLLVALDLVVLVVLVFLVMHFSMVRIRREKDRAIAAERAKDYFFSSVSHDIRTPLNAIIGFSELLKSGIEDEEERRNALNAITTSGSTLLELVNDILNLSKLEANKMVFNPEWTDLAKLASGVLHSFDTAVMPEKVRLVEDFGDLPSVSVDMQRIRQILFNLIGNAVKFTEHGEVRLALRFEAPAGVASGTGRLTMAVTDTGCGITPENQKRLMQPFVQVESHGNAQKNGTGLGLFICKQLAQRMGGALTLESEFGKGSTFTVTLPTVEFSTRRKMEPSEADDSMTIVRRDLRILVVDDVPVNRHVLQAMLKHLQIQHVTFAENGAEALRLLHDAPDAFNLILTDLWMPEMNGEALVREIRRDQRWQELPVYAVTADAEAQRSFAESGFTGLLLKPVTLDKLRAIILKADEPQRHPAEPTGGK